MDRKVTPTPRLTPGLPPPASAKSHSAPSKGIEGGLSYAPKNRLSLVALLALCLLVIQYIFPLFIHIPTASTRLVHVLDRNLRLDSSSDDIGHFFHEIRVHQDVCPAADGAGRSHTGYIGLKDDTPTEHRRTFFWLHEAQIDAQDAPVILTFGGGPGTSGLINPLFGQGHCLLAEGGTTVPNPDAWSYRYNLLAIDHPIGAGFSYGAHVNSSRAAAFDVYEFLQRFYILYPHLAGNPLFISGGSYGGFYVPHVATVFSDKNAAVKQGRLQGYRHVPLEGLILSNPMSDPISHYRWLLQTLCYDNDAYNSTTCDELHQLQPACLEGLDSVLNAKSGGTLEDRLKAQEICFQLMAGDMHGTVREDTRRKCYVDPDDEDSQLACHPEFGWADAFFNNDTVKHAIGAKEDITWVPVRMEVLMEFHWSADRMQRAHLLYEPLLANGIRLLHYVGLQDANCGWRGVLSFLKLIRSPFQDAFVAAPDVPWIDHSASNGSATVRAIGEGAGNMTLVLLDGAGHFVNKDQPFIGRRIVEHWIENVPYIQ